MDNKIQSQIPAFVWFGHEVKWNQKNQRFEVRTVGGKEVLFFNEIGKACCGWITAKSKKDEEENENDHASNDQG